MKPIKSGIIGIVIGIILFIVALILIGYNIADKIKDDYFDEYDRLVAVVEQTKEPFLQPDYILAGLNLSSQFQDYLQEGVEDGWWTEEFITQVFTDDLIPIYVKQYMNFFQFLKVKLEDTKYADVLNELKEKAPQIKELLESLDTEQLIKLRDKIMSFDINELILAINHFKDVIASIDFNKIKIIIDKLENVDLDNLKNKIEDVKDKLEDIKDKLDDIKNQIGDIKDSLGDIKIKIDNIKDIIMNIKDVIDNLDSDEIHDILNQIEDIIDDLLDLVDSINPDYIQSIIDQIKDILDQIDNILDNLNLAVLLDILEALHDLIDLITDFINNLSNLIQTIISFVMGILPMLDANPADDGAIDIIDSWDGTLDGSVYGISAQLLKALEINIFYYEDIANSKIVPINVGVTFEAFSTNLQGGGAGYIIPLSGSPIPNLPVIPPGSIGPSYPSSFSKPSAIIDDINTNI